LIVLDDESTDIDLDNATMWVLIVNSYLTTQRVDGACVLVSLGRRLSKA